MFTGIVEEIGTVEALTPSKDAYQLKIKTNRVLEDVHLGDSISVNGVCLTVTSYKQGEFTVDVMPETVKASTIQTLSRGASVNLERAMAANGRFGGHFVAGHVDGVGKILRRSPLSNAVYYEIEVDPSLLHFMVDKGSITVDGTSLTLFELTDHSFTISLIPHTLSETVLGQKDKGSLVNIECDMMAKYIRKFLEPEQNHEKRSNLTPSFLEKNGFM
jgi:riboflavin synthase